MPRAPNILLVTADDHAAAAVGCYGSRVNRTPQIDRVAAEGMRFARAACTNSLCAPSRATLLTGTYSHVNGVTTLSAPFDARQPTFPALLRRAGYRTGLVGKWHLGHGGHHDPRGFDYWEVLRDQGEYYDPELFDRERDPAEMHNRYDDPAYAAVVERLCDELLRQIHQVGDEPPTSLASLTTAAARSGPEG